MVVFVFMSVLVNVFVNTVVNVDVFMLMFSHVFVNTMVHVAMFMLMLVQVFANVSISLIQIRIYHMQCPSSNQPTQCHEARRGKCKKRCTTFWTRKKNRHAG